MGYRRGIRDITAIEQVITGAGDIADHFDRRLAAAASLASTDPGHALIAAFGFGLLDSCHRIGLVRCILQGHAFGQLLPT